MGGYLQVNNYFKFHGTYIAERNTWTKSNKQILSINICCANFACHYCQSTCIAIGTPGSREIKKIVSINFPCANLFHKRGTLMMENLTHTETRNRLKLVGINNFMDG